MPAALVRTDDEEFPPMKKLLFLAAPLLCAVAASCSVDSYQRVPMPAQNVSVTNANVARIYVVRDDTTLVQKKEVRILDGDDEIGTLTSKTYLCWERPAGRRLGRAFYESLDPSRGRLDGVWDINCEPGQTYYFNVRVGKEDGRPSVELVEEEEGRRLVAERKPAPQR